MRLSAAGELRLTFASAAQHRAHLAARAALPAGFKVATRAIAFVPAETPRPAKMNLGLVALDRPTAAFAAVYTRNALAGAPVTIGRRRLAEPQISALIVNNKVANVGAPGGEATAERVCAGVAAALGCASSAVLPASTGVIGWRLPEPEIAAALPGLVGSLDAGSALPLAEAMMTTDLYPKLRRADLAGGSIVAVAKGAGMIEPNLGTMLAFVLTDLAVPRDMLRAMLPRAADRTFNSISVDSDTSTSDMMVALSSGARPAPDPTAFETALTTVCGELAHDIVRNGEGVHHVMRVAIRRAPTAALARAIGRAIVNSPLVKTAVAGNDPNVGRLVAAVGKLVGTAPEAAGIELGRVRVTVADRAVFEHGAFALSPEAETALTAHLRAAELYASRADERGLFRPPIDFPPHELCVEIGVDLAAGDGEAIVYGADLTHEYVSENADYRS